MNDVLLNKKVSIERCISQVKTFYSSETFAANYQQQDAICLNLLRACELALDIANHVIKTRKLGLPQDSKDCFKLLREAGLIGEPAMIALQSLVGFRNILTHDYGRLDLDIVVQVIEFRMQELLDFANAMLNQAEA